MFNWEREGSVRVCLRVHRQSGRVTSWFSPFQSPSHSLSSLYRSLSDQSVDRKAPLAFLTPHGDHQQKQTSVARDHELVFPIKHDKKRINKNRSQPQQNENSRTRKYLYYCIQDGLVKCVWQKTHRAKPTRATDRFFPAHIQYVTRCDALFCPPKKMHTAFFGLAGDTDCLISKCMFACVSLCSFSSLTAHKNSFPRKDRFPNKSKKRNIDKQDPNVTLAKCQSESNLALAS